MFRFSGSQICYQLGVGGKLPSDFSPQSCFRLKSTLEKAKTVGSGRHSIHLSAWKGADMKGIWDYCARSVWITTTMSFGSSTLEIHSDCSGPPPRSMFSWWCWLGPSHFARRHIQIRTFTNFDFGRQVGQVQTLGELDDPAGKEITFFGNPQR